MILIDILIFAVQAATVLVTPMGLVLLNLGLMAPINDLNAA